MYGIIVLNVFVSVMPPYNVDLIFIRVVEVKTANLLIDDDFKIHWVSRE